MNPPQTVYEEIRDLIRSQNELLEVLARGIQAQNELLARRVNEDDPRRPTPGMPPRPNENIAPQRLDKIAPQVAPASDLDGQYGDPQVRKDPPRWQGPSYAGARYSECPREYLETLAGFLDWQAERATEKNEMTSGGKPRAGYLRADAARARGWALRNAKRPGMHRPAPAPAATGTDDEIPF